MNSMIDNKLAQVFHYDLYGKREEKYKFLSNLSIHQDEWIEVEVLGPNYFLVPKDFKVQRVYNEGLDITSLFAIYGMGITTGNDSKLISFTKIELINLFSEDRPIKEIQYRFFDKRYIFYDVNKVERARESLMTHFLDKNNIGLLSLRGVRNNLTSKFGITNRIIDKSIISTLDNGYIFPLYLYLEELGKHALEKVQARTPNLNSAIVQRLAIQLDLTFTPEKETTPDTFAPIDILDYIYAVLHSPTYREKYKEFLKIDFPRVPYPKDTDTFWKLVKLGGELRQLHLMESPALNNLITQYPLGGSNLVEKVVYQDGRVYINKEQYFANVPQVAWEFYIGGYQPAQKWLKDRKGRTLLFDDILHYQKIIVALAETDRVMREIDSVNID